MKSHSFKASENRKKLQRKEPLTGKGNMDTIKDGNCILNVQLIESIHSHRSSPWLLSNKCGIKMQSWFFFYFFIFFGVWFIFSFCVLYWSWISHLDTFQMWENIPWALCKASESLFWSFAICEIIFPGFDQTFLVMNIWFM